MQMVNWTDHVSDFNYSVGANMTYSRFWDWEQYDTRHSNSWDVYRNSIWHRVGYVNWGYEAVGRFTSWEQIATYPIDNDRKGNKTVVPGDIMYKDVNGDGVINYMDERQSVTVVIVLLHSTLVLICRQAGKVLIWQWTGRVRV